jgi:hypothetical protein
VAGNFWMGIISESAGVWKPSACVCMCSLSLSLSPFLSLSLCLSLSRTLARSLSLNYYIFHARALCLAQPLSHLRVSRDHEFRYLNPKP